MVLGWVKKICWQRIFLTDLTDGFGGWVGDKIRLAADFVTDLTDGFSGGEKERLATDFFNGFNGWVWGN